MKLYVACLALYVLLMVYFSLQPLHAQKNQMNPAATFPRRAAAIDRCGVVAQDPFERNKRKPTVLQVLQS
jgi:hypothetical protein